MYFTSAKFSRTCFCSLSVRPLIVSRNIAVPSPSLICPFTSTIVIPCICRVPIFTVLPPPLHVVIVTDFSTEQIRDGLYQRPVTSITSKTRIYLVQLRLGLWNGAGARGGSRQHNADPRAKPENQ